jgi:hypothetical protein
MTAVFSARDFLQILRVGPTASLRQEFGRRLICPFISTYPSRVRPRDSPQLIGPLYNAITYALIFRT